VKTRVAFFAAAAAGATADFFALSAAARWKELRV
jgi:hypothetical protein